MKNESEQRDGIVRMDPRFAWAIHAFAAVSFLTTVNGVASIGPAFRDEPVFAASWWVVSVCLAGGISLSIAAMSFQLWERVTLPRLAAVIGLATVAAIFDASFFQREYARFDLAENAQARALEQRIEEHKRLSIEGGAMRAKVAEHLDARIAQASQRMAEANSAADYEQFRHPNPALRRCGPRCAGARQQAAGFASELERLRATAVALSKTPAVPASNSWDDLTAYHATIARLVSDFPGTQGIVLPAPPNSDGTVLEGGRALGKGGLGLLFHMLLRGEVGDPVFVVPCLLAALCEYSVLLLVLGARTWSTLSIWIPASLEQVRSTVDDMPALLPTLMHVVRRGVLSDEPGMGASGVAAILLAGLAAVIALGMAEPGPPAPRERVAGARRAPSDATGAAYEHLLAELDSPGSQRSLALAEPLPADITRWNEALLAFAASHGLEIAYTENCRDYAGRYFYEEKIELCRTLDPPQFLHVLLHELGHHLQHRLGAAQLTDDARQAEAEATAIIVGEQLGLDTLPAGAHTIRATYHSDSETVRDSEDRVLDMARVLLREALVRGSERVRTLALAGR